MQPHSTGINDVGNIFWILKNEKKKRLSEEYSILVPHWKKCASFVYFDNFTSVSKNSFFWNFCPNENKYLIFDLSLGTR